MHLNSFVRAVSAGAAGELTGRDISSFLYPLGGKKHLCLAERGSVGSRAVGGRGEY